jgi:hypothetical protein
MPTLCIEGLLPITTQEVGPTSKSIKRKAISINEYQRATLLIPPVRQTSPGRDQEAGGSNPLAPTNQIS